ncbi:OmpP1/FadL family transporter [Nitratidesulfovibrio vulgaris]|jgi:long-chain fatty acid transport protein|uniref:Outer membrane transport protein, OmpP1/FadL/TodX family n=2 Tax=Nitratidesulfovibrio vulgaris TaxID=881 RepID=Q72BT6_NITV2|nr:OmpP1/FadL family transporter [Nitratidesulfovibrio vulgaris]AAS96026.1 outer membrane transport protein, OmpP1/FadL/TodX family [Nitratidesulfovibrio vulgaris str. Hildenborough]ABM28602.1 membrane protein involved in aromatic hydrocarbon degradation [Nitratidesulfovibrio vulgaris DP4]ADP86897.1 membrane protein involved in aromatic hydrocarbon degradation [Nitratidesulfovibrio vulgaris RCH1]GEB79276.1 OmpP1/FadL/TodX family outer membrane transporter [Desulfovibrio desulfuricans]
MRKVLLVLCLALCPLQAWAAGYGVYEWSARGNALGGAMVARDADPSSVAYNPAAITDLEGAQIQMGATAIAPTAKMTSNTPGKRDAEFSDSIWGLPTFYYTQQLSDNYWFGFGMFSRVGLGTDYKDTDTWPGRYNCSYAAIHSVSLNPNLAMKLTDELSVAFGLDATYLRFMYDTTISPVDVMQQIDADGWAYGLNLGARYKPYDWLAFGVAWRSEMQLTVNGNVDFTQKGAVPAPAARDVRGTEPIPESITFGVMVKPFDKLSLEVDAVWTRWSAYNTLVINYDPALYGKSSVSAEKNWKNTWRLQFGAEYALTDSIDLRAGYVYDQTPVDDAHEDYAVPCSDRQIATTGIGWKINEAWVLDASYSYLWMTDREYEARSGGIYDSTREDAHAHMAGLSLTYKF